MNKTNKTICNECRGSNTCAEYIKEHNNYDGCPDFWKKDDIPKVEAKKVKSKKKSKKIKQSGVATFKNYNLKK